MRIGIRVDASYQIGTGHVMRCLALAEELRRKDTEVVFVCREHPGHLCEIIQERSFKVLRLKESTDRTKEWDLDSGNSSDEAPAHSKWLGTDQNRDVIYTREVLQKELPLDWIIVDHYALDQRWESQMRESSARIMVIDDLADRRHDCDLFLDQNYFQGAEERYAGLLPEKCQMLLGPWYALLRPEFRRAREFCSMRGGGVARVLIYFGGSDVHNLTGLALQAMNCPQLSHLLVDMVAGANNQNLEELQREADKRPGTRLHVQPEGFPELLLRADLCIGAGGATSWERLCLGLPAIVISVAENQEKCMADLDRDGYVDWLGRREDVGVQDIRDAVQRQILWSRDLTGPGFELVDGLGAVRVAFIIVEEDSGGRGRQKKEVGLKRRSEVGSRKSGGRGRQKKEVRSRKSDVGKRGKRKAEEGSRRSGVSWDAGIKKMLGCWNAGMKNNAGMLG